MTITNPVLIKITNKYAVIPQVEAVLLAGSRTAGTIDADSDYDIYVYVTKEIPPADREALAKEFSEEIEIDNQFWEPGDEWIIRETGIKADIMYRWFDWIEDQLASVVVRCEARVGYTTCFWSNILASKILFDRSGKAGALKKKYSVMYPARLRENIISKNYPILRETLSSYLHQIELALKRQDTVSVNHRVAALFASYFDILFAVNELPHPGEKKLVKIITKQCSKVPQDMEKNLNQIVRYAGEIEYGYALLEELNLLIDNLDVLLETEGLRMGDKNE